MSDGQRVLCPNESDPAHAQRCALAIMTKAPRAGEVKTRLTPPLSAAEAAALNICFLRDLSTSIDKAGRGSRGIGCYTPVGAEAAYRDILPARFALIAQRGGDFGQRLAGAIEDLLSVSFSSVCLINSDSPTAPAAVFAEAARLLSLPNERLVLGPSEDGGYYLIGMKQLHPRLFEDIDWSTDRVLTQTRARATEIELEVELLPACYDVDDRSGLQQLCQELLGPNESQSLETAPATRAFLREIVAREGRARIWPASLTQTAS
ncbi:MAG: TIGR04282 family arsenosugar biosynthesis glycosyltransferase [Chthoniobacterales bacterium]|nr:TIGR04282 family arsenosugar biosynthesis glycosyltransferase [Chthoniobacterales bacterium]